MSFSVVSHFCIIYIGNFANAPLIIKGNVCLIDLDVQAHEHYGIAFPFMLFPNYFKVSYTQKVFSWSKEAEISALFLSLK